VYVRRCYGESSVGASTQQSRSVGRWRSDSHGNQRLAGMTSAAGIVMDDWSRHSSPAYSGWLRCVANYCFFLQNAGCRKNKFASFFRCNKPVCCVYQNSISGNNVCWQGCGLGLETVSKCSNVSSQWQNCISDLNLEVLMHPEQDIWVLPCGRQGMTLLVNKVRKLCMTLTSV